MISGSRPCLASERARMAPLICSPKANSTVAKPISSGTRISKIRFDVSISSIAPIPAPITEARTSPTKPRSSGGNCVRSDKAAIRLPGVSAAILEAMAEIGVSPTAIRVGKVISAAPPARLAIVPPARPATPSNAAAASSMVVVCPHFPDYRVHCGAARSGQQGGHPANPWRSCKRNDARHKGRGSQVSYASGDSRSAIRRTPESRSAPGRGSAHGCHACPRRYSPFPDWRRGA